MSASKTPELTDFDLVAAYRQGDEGAATELVRRHVYRHADRLSFTCPDDRLAARLLERPAADRDDQSTLLDERSLRAQ